jgi:hypothetical protein
MRGPDIERVWNRVIPVAGEKEFLLHAERRLRLCSAHRLRIVALATIPERSIQMNRRLFLTTSWAAAVSPFLPKPAMSRKRRTLPLLQVFLGVWENPV